MKRIKGKYIRLTESQLNKLVDEAIEKHINKIITEYADPRKEVIKWLRGYFKQIAENWCLIKFCTLSGNDINQCKNHWRTELLNILSICGSFKLKGNNDYNHRIQVIEESESGQELLTDAKVINVHIRSKFIKENVEMNNDNKIIYFQCIDELIANKDIIIHLIANWDENEIKEYINKI